MNCNQPWEDRSAPATYCIYMDGEINPARLNRQARMRVDVERDRRGRPVTKLTAVLASQAQLIGVLLAMYEMGFTLVSVVRTDEAG